jgi:serine/threonine-protein kinase RsbW
MLVDRSSASVRGNASEGFPVRLVSRYSWYNTRRAVRPPIVHEAAQRTELVTVFGGTSEDVMGASEIQVDIIVPSHTRYLALIGNVGEQLARELDRYSGDRESLAYNLNLVLTEAMVNAIEHSSHAQLHKKVRVHIRVGHDDLQIKVYDQGQGFDLDAVPSPKLDELLERGRGLFLMRTLMDSVKYYRTADGNVLEMRKHLV